jgi:hypothetical protein
MKSDRPVNAISHILPKTIYMLIFVIVFFGFVDFRAPAADVAGHIRTIYFLEAGIDVKVYDGNNNLMQATVTDQTGLFHFMDVPPGTYHHLLKVLRPTPSSRATCLVGNFSSRQSWTALRRTS